MVRKPFLFIFVTVLVLVLDQFLKFLVLISDVVWQTKVVTIHLVTNTGAGFGLFQGGALFLGILSFLVAFLLIFWYTKIHSGFWSQFFAALFLGGVVGNGIDRLFRGYVIDFIDFPFWPAFNVADAAISVAVVGYIIVSWRKDSSLSFEN